MWSNTTGEEVAEVVEESAAAGAWSILTFLCYYF